MKRMVFVALAMAMPGMAAAQDQTVPVTSQAPALDPVLVAKAAPIAAALLPDGTIENMMGPMMQNMMGTMTDSMMKTPVRDLLKISGMDATKVDSLGEGTTAEVMQILDPAFQKRLDVMTRTMIPAMGRFMSRFEPDIRAGMAEAFAQRYSAAELDEINRFLATPTGAKFGAGFMQLAADPHYLARMQTMIPQMMQALPSIMKESEAELAKLPKARTYKDLSPSERARLAELLGDDPKKMKP